MLMLMALTASLVIITAGLTLLESILIYMDEVRLACILSSEPPRKKLLKKIIKNKQAYLSSVVLLINLLSIGGSAIAGGVATQVLSDWHQVLFSVTLTYFMLVFAKMLPKLLGPQLASRTLPRASLFLYIMYIFVTPLRWVTMVWARLFKIQEPQTFSKDELKYLLRHLNHEGSLSRDTRKALERILASETRTVGMLSKPVSSIGLQMSDTVGDVKSHITNVTSKKIVVEEGGKIVGVVQLSDILQAVEENREKVTLGSLVVPVSRVDELTPLLEALRKLKKEKKSSALIFNEGSFWVVTVKAIYKSLFKKAV